MKTLEDYKNEIVETSTAAGWYEDTRSLGEECALLHSEVAEMFEAFRSWGFDDKTRDMCTHDHADDSWDGSYCHEGHVCKPQGVGSEAADVMIRLLDFCNRQEVNVERMQVEALTAKEDVRLFGSFGDQISVLHSSIAINQEKKNPLGIAIGLYTVLLLVCEENELDLITETERKMAFNKTRAYRHGGKRI